MQYSTDDKYLTTIITTDRWSSISIATEKGLGILLLS
jgi:hypothetical protein